MKLLTAVQFDGYSPKKDKTISLRFITQEKTPSEVMEIHSMLDSFGYLFFKSEEQLTNKEIEEIDHLDTDLYDNAKTQSQRMRNVFHVLWGQDNKGFKKFKDFYKSETEKIIQHYKNKLI